MRRLILACLLLGFVTSAFAADDIDIQKLAQQDFSDLSQDMGAVLSYKALQGAAPEGITGFDVSLNGGWTKVAHTSAWNTATGNNDITGVPFANLRISKGLPFGIDIGGEYSAVPGSNIKLYGVEGRYAILDGGVAEPAIGIRATFTHVTGVDNLNFNTKSLGISISKGFGPFTPYAGVGEVWTNSTPDASTGLQSVSFNNAEVYAGLQFNLGIHLALEANRLSGNTTYSLKFGFGF
ncbi:MAG TPA: hypothetical protein VFK12_00650 [Gammaproteobacteria bacterium]|jgi:hypothetical protein|nr:hypothetical protein [Gammaproteobacteria bacterium]